MSNWHVRMRQDAWEQFEFFLDLSQQLVASVKLREIAQHSGFLGALGSVDENSKITTRRTKIFGFTFFLLPDPKNEALIVTLITDE